VVVPRVPGSAAVETGDGMRLERFRYFPGQWEDLAAGAIIENLRARPSRWLQVVPFFVAQVFAIRRAVRCYRPQVLHVHWIIPQGVVALRSSRRAACPGWLPRWVVIFMPCVIRSRSGSSVQ